MSRRLIRTIATLAALAIGMGVAVVLDPGLAGAGGAGVADPATSTLSASPTSIYGNDTSTITVTLKDSSNNPLTKGGDAVVCQTSLGTISVATDNGNGTYTCFLVTKSPDAGTATISATVNGQTITSTTNVTVTASTPDQGQSLLLAPATTMALGQTMKITVALQNQEGKQLAYRGNNVICQAPSEDMSAAANVGYGGAYVCFLHAVNRGTVRVTATVDGQPISNSLTITIS